jgi:D-arabinose 1-dehydrogenase-like Zn-dependent alcohol dehydrogenase
MKAMYLVKPGVIVSKDVPLPSLAPNEVLIKVKAVGICRSDIALKAAVSVILLSSPR